MIAPFALPKVRPFFASQKMQLHRGVTDFFLYLAVLPVLVFVPRFVAIGIFVVYFISALIIFCDRFFFYPSAKNFSVHAEFLKNRLFLFVLFDYKSGGLSKCGRDEKI